MSRSAACAALVLLSVSATPHPSAAPPSPKQAIVDLEQTWLASEDNPSALESILADDFVHVLSSGFVTKGEQLDFMRRHPAPRSGDRHFQDLRVRVYGSAAIANGIVAARAADGKPQKTIFTDVFAYRNGKWQAVNAQELPLSAGATGR
ncbi:MAG TPA: nuclear transport factor 2 family protein [Vicinamibacterales bacterium]|nr:nuclear transport factor 2 family protein [Vicinamibacterales bacterium]